MSLAVNVLTNSRKVRDVTKRDFFRLKFFHVDQYICERCCRPDWNSVSARLPCYFLKGPLKRDFLEFIYPRFSGLVKSKIRQLSGSSFLWKYSKLNLDFQNAQKKLKKVFCFWDNCIWRCCIKLPLLRRECLSLGVNVLTSSPNMMHITRESFSLWIVFAVISKYGKGAVVKISKVFCLVYNVTCWRVLSNGTF